MKLLSEIYRMMCTTRMFFWKLTGVSVGNNSIIGKNSLLINGKNIKIGNNVKISNGTNIEAGIKSLIIIGDNVKINRNCWITGEADIFIGDYTQIGPNVVIISNNHSYKNKNIKIFDQGLISEPIKIEQDCWIAANVVITPGITIGTGSVVAANSVVTKNVEPYSVVGGVPAKIISYRE